MTRRRRDKKKKGIPPAFAIVALIGSAAYFSQSIIDLYSTDAPPASPGSDVSSSGPVEEAPEADALPDHEVGDLLKTFGSYDEAEEVRWAFQDIDSIDKVASAPAGEVSTKRRPIWLGDDPPMLRLSLVMVSSGSRQAVLGGELVGVGEACAGGEVLSIEPGVVVLRWNNMDLTYELNNEVAVEFRGEWTRRQMGDVESSAGESEEGKR